MRFVTIFALFIFQLNSLGVAAETSQIDSVKKELKDEKDLKEKINHYIALGNLYSDLNPDSGALYCQKALAEIDLFETGNNEAYANLYMAKNLMSISSPDSVERFLNKANELFKENNYRIGILETSIAHSLFKSKHGEIEEAILTLESVITEAKKLDNIVILVNANNVLGQVYFSWGKFEKAKINFHKAEKLAEKAKLFKDNANNLNKLGYAISNIGQNDSAQILYEKALAMSKKFGFKISEASSLELLGKFYLDQSNYGLSFEYYQKSLEIRKEIGDIKHITNSYLNIGLVLLNQKEEDKAIEYFNKAIERAKKVNDLKVLAATYTNMGIIYKRRQQYNKVIELYNKSLDLAKLQNDRYSEARVLGNLGSLYQSMCKYKKSVEFMTQARKLKIELGTIRDLIYDVQNLGYLNFLLTRDTVRTRVGNENTDFLKSKEFHLNRSIKLLERSIHLVDSINGEKSQKMYALGNLAFVHYHSNNYEKAFNIYIKYHNLFADINNEESAKKIAKLVAVQEKLEAEKALVLSQEREKIQQEAAKRRNYLLAILAFSSVLLFALSFLVFNRYRITNNQNIIIEKQKEKLAELDQAKNNFFTNISHEFRTPLTVILGAAGNLDNSEDSNLIKRNGQRLLKLINQILDLSKLEDGSLTVNKKQVDAIGFTKYLVDSYKSLALSQNKKLDFKSDTEDLAMDLDEDKYQTIISNLVSNAIKFTPENGNISISTRTDANQLIVKVKDSGPGILPNEMEKLFDRFYQVQGDKDQKVGSGVGLALTKELVALFNGSISVQNNEEGGAEFTLRLPITNEAKKAEPSFKSQTVEKTTFVKSEEIDVTDANEKSILLLVEDEPDIQRFIQSALQESYQVLIANNGQEGVELAFEYVPDIILSDVMMPIKDGLELTDELKNDKRTSHIPIVLLTAKVDLESRLQGLQRGADVYLPKPFEKNELLLQLNNLQKQQQRTRDFFANSAAVISGSDMIAEIDAKTVADFVDERENKFISGVKDSISENLDNEAFSIEELSQAIGLSRTQLHRKLKALTGKSTTQFVNEFKVEHATKLLLSNEYNIAEVAYSVGFSDPSYFSRVFSKIKGLSPREFLDKKTNS